MPPKGKKEEKKSQAAIVRPAISSSSLFVIPEDVTSGFEDRVEIGVHWSSAEVAFRNHSTNCRKEDLPILAFHEAFINKIEGSILGNLIKDSLLSLEEQVDLLPTEAWDNENFGTAEAKTCFQGNNNITDDLVIIIKEAVKAGDRKLLIGGLKKATTLRLIDCKMTDLDKTLSKFNSLYLLNMACNYLETPDAELLPPQLKMLELQANRIRTVHSLMHVPPKVVYLGLSRNFLARDCGLEVLRCSNICVLDLSDNDICELTNVTETLSELKQMCSLALAGNPCALCAGYASYTLAQLPRLHWLDWRQVLPEDRPRLPPPSPSTHNQDEPPSLVHPDDLRSAYFVFTCYRIIALPMPPKPEKGVTATFHVELELPFLDSKRRQFLFYRNSSSLTQLLPEPEGYTPSPSPSPLSKRSSIKGKSKSKLKDSITSMIGTESKMSTQSSEKEDIFARLERTNSRLIINYKVFESARLPWSKLLTFQNPTLRIFCPDLVALRNTFRTNVTIRVVYTMTAAAKGGGGKKGADAGKSARADEQRLVLANVVCSLKTPDWSQKMQDFHWDDSIETDKALHCEGGELAGITYNIPGMKPAKTGKKDTTDDLDPSNAPRTLPENLTCHFGFGIETIPLTVTL